MGGRAADQHGFWNAANDAAHSSPISCSRLIVVPAMRAVGCAGICSWHPARNVVVSTGRSASLAAVRSGGGARRAGREGRRARSPHPRVRRRGRIDAIAHDQDGARSIVSPTSPACGTLRGDLGTSGRWRRIRAPSLPTQSPVAALQIAAVEYFEPSPCPRRSSADVVVDDGALLRESGERGRVDEAPSFMGTWLPRPCFLLGDRLEIGRGLVGNDHRLDQVIDGMGGPMYKPAPLEDGSGSCRAGRCGQRPHLRSFAGEQQAPTKNSIKEVVGTMTGAWSPPPADRSRSPQGSRFRSWEGALNGPSGPRALRCSLHRLMWRPSTSRRRLRQYLSRASWPRATVPSGIRQAVRADDELEKRG